MCEGQPELKSTRKGANGLLAVIPCLLWASATTFMKLGYRFWNIESGSIWSMVLFSGVRFTIAGLLLILYQSLRKHRFDMPKGRNGWRSVFIICLFSTVLQYVFNCIGVGNASGVAASMLNGTGSLFSILLACSFFRQEKTTLQKAIGCSLSISGIVLMNLNGGHFAFTLLGEGFILVGSVCGGIGTCTMKNFCSENDAITLTAWQSLMGGVLMIGLAYTLGGRLEPFSLPGSGCLLYLGMLSAVAYGLWNWLIQKTSISSVSIYGFLMPILGVFITACALGEWNLALQPNRLAALVLICLGIIVVNYRKKNKPS